jgi:tetratricopeptide (TPR) repeat protein
MVLPPVILIVFVASFVPIRAQRDVDKQGLSAVGHWMQKSYEATDRYRSGDLNGALALLGSMTNEEQEKAVNGIRAQMERIAAGWPPRKEDVVPWTPRLLRALAALHMEAAIVARNSTDRDADDVADDHIALAITAFGAATALTGEQDTFAAQWILAIGLERMAEGEFVDAYRILTPHCGDKQTYARLLVACGTVHETFASLTAAQILRLVRRPGPAIPQMELGVTLGRNVRDLARARLARNEQLEQARRYFERALTLDSLDPEALLRFAQVRVQQKDDRAAAEILEKLAARPSLNQRERYLARLFLARIRDRQNRLDDAAAVLAQTATHQSSLIARAHNAQRLGDARAAAAHVERAALLGTDDPWWGYRYGQYWLPLDLLQGLREEARK